MFRIVSLALALAAGVVSGYLLWTAGIGGELPLGCGGEGGCGEVLGSRWSRWCGIPTSGLGTLAYLVFSGGILVFLLRPASRRALQPAFLILSGTGLLVIGWFIGIQVFVLQAFCIYCMAAHLLGGLSYLAMILAARKAGVGARTWTRTMVTALFAAVVFAVLHVGFLPDAVVVEAAAEAAPEGEAVQLGATPTRRSVSLLKGRIQFVIDEVPLLGSADATHVVLEIFDYTCNHCRDLHKVLHHLMDTYPSEFAVVVFPFPLSRRCNPVVKGYNPIHRDACEYAKYSLGIFVADPAKFLEYHDYLMTGKQAPAIETALETATLAIGEAEFQRALADPRIPELLGDGRKLMRMMGRTAVPLLVTPDGVLAFREVNEDTVIAKLEAMLGLE